MSDPVLPDGAGAVPDRRRTLTLALAAIGVVYGDIGTSPLYALKESLSESTGITLTEANVLGILSLMFWSLVGVVTVKYVIVILRADNRGEGGVLALMALANSIDRLGPATRRTIVALGMSGAALFYGDCILTPAISVLSAVEGLNVATEAFTPYVVPLAVLILIGLFAIQRHGTGRVGAWFGPITALWFVVLFILGLIQIAQNPVVLWAVDPRRAMEFFATHQLVGFLALGAVVLTITGAEALYADLGHFGPRPIRLAWLTVVLPALLTNYFGQGALVLRDPDSLANPFYKLVPEWGVIPMVVLATAATVIASQAVISGAFSMARQAALLGLSPRLAIRQTSAQEFGQIYAPAINWMLLAGVVLLVVQFRTSSALASAYGIAVTGTMLVTSVLAVIVARRIWGWSWPAVGVVFGTFALIDATFLSANLAKIVHGGWVPIALGAVIYLVMYTWRRGRAVVADSERDAALPLDLFVERLRPERPLRIRGTAVYLTAFPQDTPRALLHNLKHNQVLHERVIVATVTTRPVPRVAEAERIAVEEIGKGVERVIITFGFMQTPNVPRALARAAERGLPWDAQRVSYFLSRDFYVVPARSRLPRWQGQLFAALTRLAAGARSFYRLPTGQVVELGGQMEV